MKKFMTLIMVVIAMTLAVPTQAEAAAKPKLQKTSVVTKKNKKVTVKVKNGKIKSVKSKDKNIASVSKKSTSFTVKGGKKHGQTTITVKTTKGKTLKCTVFNEVKKASLQKKSVKTQQGKSVKVGIKNSKIASVKSSNKKVASVSYKAYKNGKNGTSFTVKGGSKSGKAIITVKTVSGKKFTCKVTNKAKTVEVPKEEEPTPAPAEEEPAPTPAPVEDEEEEPAEEEPEENSRNDETECVGGLGQILVNTSDFERVTLGYFAGSVSEELFTAYCYFHYQGVCPCAYDSYCIQNRTYSHSSQHIHDGKNC